MISADSSATPRVGHRIEQFMQNATAVGARCTRVSSTQDAAQAIVTSLQAHQSTIDSETRRPLRIGASDAPFIQEIAQHIAKSVGVPGKIIPNEQLTSPTDVFGLDVGITGVQWGVAETGTLVLATNHERNRLLSLAPSLHIAVVPVAILRDTLAEVLRHVQQPDSGIVPPGTLTLITGPSRTSDIELTLVVGVHGQRELHIILLDSPPLTHS